MASGLVTTTIQKGAARAIAFALAASISPDVASGGAATTIRPEPVLLVRFVASDVHTTDSDNDPSSERDGYAARLALASLTPEDRNRVRTVFDQVSTRLEARVNPLDVDLEDGDPLDELRDGLVPWSPAFDAARSISTNRWRLQGLTVRAARRCADASPDELCVAASGAHDDPTNLARRARFAAWPVSTLVRRDLGTVAARDRCSGSLRALARKPGSSLALVLTSEPPFPASPDLEESGRRLARAIAAAEREDDGDAIIGALRHEPSDGSGMGWLDLTETEVAVVPRLSAFFDRAAVAREVDEAVRAAASE